MSTETLKASLQLDTSHMDQALNGVEKKVGGFGQGFATAGKVIGGATLAMAGFAGALGVQGVKAAVDFNTKMADVSTLIGGNIERTNEFKVGVQEMSIATGKSTDDIAGGLYQVVSAFGDTNETMDQTNLMVKAGVAGVATTVDALNLVSAVTKGYGDTSLVAQTKASDLAFQTVVLGQTTFPELAASMGRVVPFANELGISQEELYGTMATLTGVTGSAAEVSTQYRGVLQAFMAPTAEATALFTSMGFESGKAMIAELGQAEAIKALVNAAAESGEPLQKYIGSIEGQNAAMALAGAQSDAYAIKTQAMGNAAGATERAFRDQTEGINKSGHTLQRVQQMWVVFQQKLGDAILPMLEKAMLAFMPVMDDLFAKTIPLIVTLVESLVPLIPVVLDLVAEMMPLVEDIFPLLIDLVSVLIEGITPLIKAIMPVLVKLFEAVMEAILPIIEAILPVLVELILILADFLVVLLDALEPLIPTFIELIKAILPLIEMVLPLLEAALAGIAWYIENVSVPVIKFLMEVFIVVANGIVAAVEWLDKNVVSIFTDLGQTIQTIWNAISEFFQRLWLGIQLVFSAAWEFIKGVFLKYHPIGILYTHWDSVSNWFSVLWENVKKIFGLTFEFFKKLFWDYNPLVILFVHWNKLGETFLVIWNTVRNVFNTALIAISARLTEVWGLIYNGISSSWTNILSNISRWVGNIRDRVVGVFKAMVTTIGGVWSGIGGIVKTAFNVVISVVNGAIRALNRLSIKIPDWVPGMGGSVFGFSIPQIPMLAAGGIVTKPTLAMIGEAGPEAVIPLDKLGAPGGAGQFEPGIGSEKTGIAVTIEEIKEVTTVLEGYGKTALTTEGIVKDLIEQVEILGEESFPELAATLHEVVPLVEDLAVSQADLYDPGVVAKSSASSQGLTNHWSKTADWFTEMWDEVKQVSLSTFEFLTQLFTDYNPFIILFTHWDKVPGQFAHIWDEVLSLFNITFTILREHMMDVWEGINKDVSKAWDSIAYNMATHVVNIRNKTVGAFQDMALSISAIGSTLSRQINQNFTSVSALVPPQTPPVSLIGGVTLPLPPPTKYTQNDKMQTTTIIQLDGRTIAQSTLEQMPSLLRLKGVTI